MDPAQWQRIRALFDGLVAVPLADRAAWLDQCCADDPAVREHLERLSTAEQATGGWSKPVQSMEAILDPPASSLEKGTHIGQYELQELIAVGGMGAVWRAQQREPRRIVALKTLRADLSGPEAVKRFRAEAQILGYLKHASIARVFEAGLASLDGRTIPYLAMEYIEGSRDLVASCNDRGLDRRGRLQIFARVCDAVHHGHQRGVVHRDLKPGNVLVDPDGHPKVIDFGLARVLAPDELHLSVARTRAGELLGTLAYMSPEHVTGPMHEVDARSDIYALGCILFELLTGRTPFDLRGLPFTEAMRRIGEGEPSIPSRLPADLRWVLRRCLEKAPDRRYAAASELAADVRRYLAHEPVLAGPPSRIYRLGRFARRHRALLLATLGIMVTLATGLFQARREAHAARLAEKAAEQEKEEAETARSAAAHQLAISAATADALAQLIELPSPYEEGGSVLVRDAIAKAELRLSSISEPTARATIGAIVARGLLRMDRRASAGKLLEDALPVLRVDLAPTDPLRLRAEVTYADFLEMDERFAESIELSDRLLPTLEQALGADHSLTVYLRNNLGVCKRNAQDWAGAIEAFQDNLDLLDRSPEGPGPSSARVDLLRNIGMCLVFQGSGEEGRAMLEQALAMARTLGGDAPQREGLILMDLGIARALQGEFELALEHYREASPLFDLDPPEASNRFTLEYQRAAALHSLGRYDEAAEAASACRAVLESTWNTQGMRAVTLSSLECGIASAREDHAGAVAIAREAINVGERLSPQPREALGQLRSTLSKSLLATGEAEQAAQEAELAHATLAQALGAESRQANLALERWVRALLALDEASAATDLAKLLVERTAPDHPQRAAREELLRTAQQETLGQ